VPHRDLCDLGQAAEVPLRRARCHGVSVARRTAETSFAK
jgi:hypothetical protein